MTAVEPAGDQAAVAAADVLCESHASYPAFVHALPARRARRRVLRPFLHATVTDAVHAGTVTVVREGGAPAATAVWLPPGAARWDARRMLRAAPRLARAFAAAPVGFARLARIGSALSNEHPREPHWYLVAIGVRPTAQGRGLGALLLTDGLRRADADGAACYVETSDPANVPWYRRFGFVEASRMQPLAGGPTYTMLWRPPVSDPTGPGAGPPVARRPS